MPVSLRISSIRSVVLEQWNNTANLSFPQRESWWRVTHCLALQNKITFTSLQSAGAGRAVICDAVMWECAWMSQRDWQMRRCLLSLSLSVSPLTLSPPLTLCFCLFYVCTHMSVHYMHTHTHEHRVDCVDPGQTRCVWVGKNMCVCLSYEKLCTFYFNALPCEASVYSAWVWQLVRTSYKIVHHQNIAQVNSVKRSVFSFHFYFIRSPYWGTDTVNYPKPLQICWKQHI